MANKKNNAFKHVLTQLVFDLIEKSGNKAMNFNQVAAKLNLADAESRDAIRDILQEEARTGGLFKEVEKGKYALKELKARSEERRGGQECVRTCSTGGSPYN